jgi:hypothetical protein
MRDINLSDAQVGQSAPPYGRSGPEAGPLNRRPLRFTQVVLPAVPKLRFDDAAMPLPHFERFKWFRKAPR